MPPNNERQDMTGKPRNAPDRQIFPLTTGVRRGVSCVQTLQFCAASLSNDVLSSHGKTGVRRAADSLSDDEPRQSAGQGFIASCGWSGQAGTRRGPRW